MGSSSSAQRRSVSTSSQADSTRSSSTTPRLPSKEESEEVQLGAPGQPAAVVPTGGASGPSSTPSAPPPPPRTDRDSTMAHPGGLQREKTLGFSSSQPTYTSEDEKVLETFFHQNQNSCRCLFDKGKRFYFDKKRQDWIPFPADWLSRGIIVTDQTNCTEDDILEAAGKRKPRNRECDVGASDSDRHGAIYHPERGRLSTYIAEERMNVHLYFDKDQGTWVRLPLAWELHSDFVKELMTTIREALPDWKDKYEVLAALRACSYSPYQCIATYLDWGDTSSLPGVRNDADAKLVSEKQRQVADLQNQLKSLDEKLKATVAELDNEKKARLQAESMLDELRDKVSSMEAKIATLTAMTASLQRPKTPAAKRPQVDRQALGAMSESMQSLHKQHTRLRMDLVSMFDGFHVSLLEVVKHVKNIKQCDSGLGEELAQMRELYRREALQRKLLYNQLQDLRGNIRVFCRCRYDSRTKCCLQFPSETEILPPNTKKPFQFNRVFDVKSTQEEVYEDTKPLVTSCVDGYNVCILAYGQTGSGKTYTMQGPRDDPGVNVRALTDLLAICKDRDNIEYTLKASMVEIYNESIHDLLSSKLTSLEIRAQGTKITLPGMTELPVETARDIDEIIGLGEKNRSVASTKMNSQSSRSHLIFMITVRGQDKASGAVSTGTLTLCDLAGSERVSKSEATGQRLTEAAAINKSLSALGQVFSALRSSQLHIPYRNSKLTHILQPSLGGDAKACLFVMLSPDANNVSETMSTLQFGSNAQQVALGQAKKNITKGPPAAD